MRTGTPAQQAPAHRPTRLGVVGGAALAVLAAGCPGRQREPLRPVVLARSTALHTTLVAVAAEEGYFRREGLAVTLRNHPSGKAALAEVLDGKADLATVAETPLVFAAAAGKRFAILAQIFASSREHAVVARRDRGIAAAGDLAGKRVGYVPQTSGEFFLSAFLDTNGIPAARVTKVELKPERMAEELTAGTVDAVAVWNPWAIRAREAAGPNGICFFAEEAYTLTFTVVCREAFATGREREARAFLAALLSAEAYVRRNPEESLAISARASGVDPSQFRELWPAGRFRVTLTQALVESLKEETRWAVRLGLVPRGEMPRYRGMIAAGPLRSLRPEAVVLVE